MKTFLVIILSATSLVINGQIKEIDSLYQALQATPEESKIDIYQSIIIKLWLNHTDSALRFAREAIQLSEKLGDARSKSIAIRLLGGVHYYKGNYDSTIKCSHLAYQYSLQANDSSLMNTSLNNLGLAYYNVGSYPEALEYLLKALNMKIRIKQNYGMAQNMNNVGILYTELKKYDKARQYFNQAIDHATKTGDKNQILYSNNNIGFTYLDENNPLEAKLRFEKSFEVGKQVDNLNWNSVARSGMGQVYFRLGDYTTARSYFIEALSARDKISDQSGIAEVYYFLGNIHLKKASLDSAQFFIRRSQSIASHIGDKDQMMMNLQLMKEIHSKLRRYDSALHYQSEFIALRDSVMNENLARDIADVQLEIERQDSKQQLADKDYRIQQITRQTYLLIGGLLIIATISFFTYRLYQDQARLGRDLIKKNFEIEEQRNEIIRGNEELRKAQGIIHEKNLALESVNQNLQKTVKVRTKQLEMANQELRRANLELENFIYRSSHDIRGPLVRLVGLSHVALLDIKDEKAREYFRMLYDAAQQLTEIFDRLKVVSQINDMDVLSVPINIPSMLKTILDRIKFMDGFDGIEIIEEIEPFEWESDPILLEMIIQNLLENSVRFRKKFTEEKNFIRISMKEIANAVYISIVDNGIGIKNENIQHIYQMFSKAARDHQNLGLGLYIVKQAVEKLRGSVSLKNNEDGLTEFEVCVPLVHQAESIYSQVN